MSSKLLGGWAEAEARISEKRFGFTLCALAAFIAAYPLLRHHPVRTWALVLSAALLLTTLAAPDSLRGPKKVWLALAYRVSLVVSFLLMAVSFFLVVTPVAIAFRLVGRDALGLKWDKAAPSYFKRRTKDARDTNLSHPY